MKKLSESIVELDNLRILNNISLENFSPLNFSKKKPFLENITSTWLSNFFNISLISTSFAVFGLSFLFEFK